MRIKQLDQWWIVICQSVRTALSFSARRKQTSRGSIHAVYDREPPRLQQSLKIKCEAYSRIWQRYVLSYPWIELLIYLGVLMIILLVIYTFSLRVPLHTLRELKIQTKAFHHQYQSQLALIDRDRDISQLLYEKQTEFSSRLKKLLTHQSISHVLEDMHQIARRFSLIVVYFSPQNLQSQQFYSQIPLHVIVLGRYQDLVSFLNRLINHRYSITLHDFQLQPKHVGEAALGHDPLLKMDMYLQVYIK